jgi:hypothetical protein
VLRRVLVVVAVVTGMAVLGAAAGASVPAAPRRAATFDGRIRVVAASGNTIYIGGHFTHATGLDGRVVTRNRVAAVDAASGALLPWNPNANHPVYALAVAGGTVYLGGDFSSVAGTARGRLAAVDASSGAVLAWNHQANDRVWALDASASRVYAGGEFTTVDGATRGHLAAFPLAAGALDPAWRPSADGVVRALEVGVPQTRVYVGGDFPTLDGQAAHGYAGAVDAASGAIVDAFRGRVRYSVHDLAATADGVYAAGDGSGGHLVAWTPTGALKFPTVQTDGGAQAVTVLGGEVYLGGHWDNVCPEGVSQGTGGNFNCAGTALTRHKLLSVDEASGRLTGWNPGANSPLGVFGLTAAGGTLAAGGDFTRVAGVARGRFALFG